MCVDVWGAKVTRRYVPVTAKLPPKKRDQRDVKHGETVYLNNLSDTAD